MKAKQVIYFNEWKNPGLGMSAVTLAWNERGLCRVLFGRKELLKKDPYLKKHFADALFQESEMHADNLARFMADYFEKPSTDLGEIKFDLHGSPFQKKVWKAISRIPAGKTLTYGEIAKKIGIPKGPRAIGLACGQNPIPLMIPCHRVIGAGKSLGGFTAGLRLKKDLLKHEGVKCR